eukprot:1460080-Pleurochrysis_carterae.AAC.2
MMDILGKRRFANVSNTVNNSTAELRSVETELKERKRTLKTREAGMQAVRDESQQLKNDVQAALDREAASAAKIATLQLQLASSTAL